MNSFHFRPDPGEAVSLGSGAVSPCLGLDSGQGDGGRGHLQLLLQAHPAAPAAGDCHTADL